MSERSPNGGQPGFAHDLPVFTPQPWDNGTWTVQEWLERTAWRTLKSTSYGCGDEVASVIPELFTDPLLRQVYLIDVAIFIGAELTSIEAVSGLLRIAPDENSKIYLGTQVMDECRHYEVFCRRMADLGVAPQKRDVLVKRYTTPAIRRVYDLILEQVDKGDFIAGSLAQNLVMEGMAYPLYRYEIKYWSTIDPSLSRIIRGAFADESHHVGFGEAVIRHHVSALDAAERGKLQRLLGQFSGLMTEAFEQVIKHYIGLYQECANQYMERMGDVEIFPGRKLATLSEEDQARTLLQEIQREHANRSRRIGLG